MNGPAAVFGYARPNWDSWIPRSIFDTEIRANDSGDAHLS